MMPDHNDRRTPPPPYVNPIGSMSIQQVHKAIEALGDDELDTFIRIATKELAKRSKP